MPEMFVLSKDHCDTCCICSRDLSVLAGWPTSTWATPATTPDVKSFALRFQLLSVAAMAGGGGGGLPPQAWCAGGVAGLRCGWALLRCCSRCLGWEHLARLTLAPTPETGCAAASFLW